ncbi:MAG: HTH domain-containing protein [Selenomonas sp.]|nr:HTH domain-containing protein [Selenomonas sp.]
MRELYSMEELASFGKAISSELRIQIVLYVAKHPGIGLMELSQKFGVSRAAITQNIKILSAAGLIELGESGEKSSARKGCFLTEDGFLLNFRPQLLTQKIYATEIPIGQYSDFAITPTCGIATPEELIGKVDDPAYFDDPRRSQAGILWFSTGFVEYRLPNYLQPGQELSELQLSFEVSSEAPGVAENWPSDLIFALNGEEIGSWTSPGDYGDVWGRYTPDWWDPNWNQYGLLKLLTINGAGTYMDGRMISPKSIKALSLTNESELRFRIAAPAEAQNAGGCTLFGRGFGNYNQGLKFKIIYTEEKQG